MRATKAGCSAKYADLTRRAIDRAVDPASKDFLNFTAAVSRWSTRRSWRKACLRAPQALHESLDPKTKRQLIAALESSAADSAGLQQLAAVLRDRRSGAREARRAWDRMRVDYALRQHDQWYKGDGAYGDGPDFHWDYYNSFVIHPMLLDVLDAVGARDAGVEGAVGDAWPSAPSATPRCSNG